MFLRHYQLVRFTGFVFHNVARHGAGGNGVWAGQVHLTRSAATGEVTVLRTDHDLVRARGNTRPGVYAGATARLNYDCPCLLENLQISISYAVLTRFLRTKLY